MFSPYSSCSTCVGTFEEITISFEAATALHFFDTKYIAVTNRTGDVLSEVILNLQLLNESKPQQKMDVAGYLSWVGPLEVTISQLAPGTLRPTSTHSAHFYYTGATFTHALVVCAFAVGTYNILATGLLPKRKSANFVIPPKKKEGGENEDKEQVQQPKKEEEKYDVFPAATSFHLTAHNV